MLHPAFAQRTKAMGMPTERPNAMFPRYDQFAQQQNHCGSIDLLSMEEAVAEYQLARMVFQARMRAQARMSNFFMQQTRQQAPSPNTMPVMPARNAMPEAYPQQGLDLLSHTSASIVSDDNSERKGDRQLLSDRSETSSLGSSGRPATSQRRVYIDTIRDKDVLCGRGGRSNHAKGNKLYRRLISEMKQTYKSTEAKSNKTDLSRAIVDHVCRYGGRFIKKEETTGRYYVLTRGEARKKTSQALRESKALKWTK